MPPHPLMGRQADADRDRKFNRQYKGLTVSYSDDFHDRFVLIDNTELHNLGSSVNCLGRRLTTYTTRDAKEIRKILAQLP